MNNFFIGFLLLISVNSNLIASNIKEHFGAYFVTNCYEERNQHSQLTNEKVMAVCQCVWNKVSHRYSDAQLIYIDEKATETSREWIDFGKFEVASGKECHNIIRNNPRF